jgi:hypothetical protein
MSTGGSVAAAARPSVCAQAADVHAQASAINQGQ